MAEDKKIEENASKLFEALSGERMSAESKAAAAAIINENPDILISKSFLEKIALKDMNGCPKEGYEQYISQSLAQVKSTTQVLDNLQDLHTTGAVGVVKGGASPVQYVLNEGRLSNGETLGTQSLKNISYLRAMKNDAGYTNKEAIDGLQYENGYLLEKIYAKDEYGANTGRRNAMGQKASDLLALNEEEEKHVDRQALTVEAVQKRANQKTIKPTEDEKEPLSVEDLKKEPQKKNLSREELEVGAYRGTLTAEQQDQLKKLQDEKKEGDVNENAGDVSKPPERKKSKDRFTDGDVVKYMYEDWLLGGASWLFNAIEDRVLGLIDSACDVCVTNARNRRNARKHAENVALKSSQSRVDDFKGVAKAVHDGKADAYAKKAANFSSIFEDLKANINNPNPNWKHQHDPELISALQNDPQAAEFLKAAPQKLSSQLKMLEKTDQLALALANLEMTDQFMRKENSWRNGKQEHTSADLELELKARAAEKQKQLLKGIAVISEDTRLLAEVAYDGLSNPSVTDKEFIQQSINKEVNSWLEGIAKETKRLAEKQQGEIAADKFAGRGPECPDISIKSGLNKINEELLGVGEKSAVYGQAEFVAEGSKKRIETTCSLYDEAIAQNTPSVCSKCMDLNQMNQQSLDARRADQAARKEALNAMKQRLANRDGKKNVDARIAKYQQQDAARS